MFTEEIPCGVGERNVLSGPGISMGTKTPEQYTRVRTSSSGLSSNGTSNGTSGSMKLTQKKGADPFDDLKLEKVAAVTQIAAKLNSTPHATASGNAVNGWSDAF